MSRPSDPLDTISFACGSSLADIPGLIRSTCLQAVFRLSFAQKSNPLPIGLEGIWRWCLQAVFKPQVHGNITATFAWSYRAKRASEQHSTPVYNLPITNRNRFSFFQTRMQTVALKGPSSESSFNTLQFSPFLSEAMVIKGPSFALNINILFPLTGMLHPYKGTEMTV